MLINLRDNLVLNEWQANNKKYSFLKYILAFESLEDEEIKNEILLHLYDIHIGDIS